MNTSGSSHLDAATARMAARLSAADQAGRAGAPFGLRSVRDTDGPVLTRLILAAYDEFGCVPADLDGFDADLAAPATYAGEHARRWWVVTDAQGLAVASAAHSPLRPILGPEDAGRGAGLRAGPGTGQGVVELQRLYLAPEVRGSGLASLLIRGVATEAHLLGADRLVAWSDTRLTAAHVRYLALGFALSDASRRLDDPAGSIEIRFELDLPLG